MRLVIFFCFVGFSFSFVQAQDWQAIPEQAIDFEQQLKHLQPRFGEFEEETIPAFEVSAFVTYEQYKLYLATVARDSSAAFLLSQQPDSAIAPTAALYAAYVHSTTYDTAPVVGITWESALEYCKWKTLQDNPTDTLEFIYRLPTLKEWLAAHYYYQKNNLPHDMNQLLADWLLDGYYKNWSAFFHDLKSTAIFHNHYGLEAPHTWSRKMIVGNNYVYAEPALLFYNFWQFADEGQRYLGFRLIKSPVQGEQADLNKELLLHWNLIKE